MKTKKGFLQDKDGNNSMIRLITLIVVLDGLSIITFASIWHVVFGVDTLGLIGIIIGLIAPVIAAKVLQKQVEKEK